MISSIIPLYMTVNADTYESKGSVVLNSQKMSKVSIIILTRFDRTYSKDKLNIKYPCVRVMV
jgi:hypothetical protein